MAPEIRANSQGTGADGSDARLSDDDRFYLLQSSRRRETIRYLLATDEPAHIRALARHSDRARNVDRRAHLRAVPAHLRPAVPASPSEARGPRRRRVLKRARTRRADRRAGGTASLSRPRWRGRVGADGRRRRGRGGQRLVHRGDGSERSPGSARRVWDLPALRRGARRGHHRDLSGRERRQPPRRVTDSPRRGSKRRAGLAP